MLKYPDLEQALRESERNLRAVLDAMPAMIGYWDRDLRNRFGNRAYEEWFGWPPDQMPGHHIRDVLGETLFAANLPFMEAALRGESQLFERAIVTPTGEQRHAQASYIPDCPDGEVRGFFVLVTDISRRKQAEDALAASEAKLQALISMAGVGIIVTDPDLKIRLFNRTAETLFGWPATELAGCSADQLVPDAFQAAINSHLEMSLDGGQGARGIRCEVEVRRRDGTMFPAELSVGRVDSPAGIFYVGIVNDISERQHYLQTIIRTNASLEDHAVRMAALAKDLDKARLAAESANRAKSEFLSNMSHELRTPLNAILGFAQLLESDRRQPLDARHREQIGCIIGAGEHLLCLINDILDLAKIEAGKVSLSIEPISVVDLVAESLAFAEPMARKYGVSISRNIDGAGVYIRADRVRARQALLNLVSNAAKYNRPDGTVLLSWQQPEPGWVRLEVADNGPGIPIDRQTELFRPFSRLAAANTSIEGSGIGLSLTRNLMTAMGGRIGFRSSEENGSAFWLDFPQAVEELLAERRGWSADSDDLLWTLDDRPRLLLYVEDNPANLQLMEAIVRNLDGFALISAHNAELGLVLAETRLPDLIILDVSLPGISGIDAVRRLKANPVTAAIPCLALSADATRRSIEQGLNAGLRDYLTKPVKVPELIRAIARAVGE